MPPTAKIKQAAKVEAEAFHLILPSFSIEIPRIRYSRQNYRNHQNHQDGWRQRHRPSLLAVLTTTTEGM